MGILDHVHVLNVDDDPVVRVLNSCLLKNAGATCSLADNGDSCMAELAAKPDIDVVVLDYCLSASETGSDVAVRIREVRKQLPIILLSGEKNGQEIADADPNINYFLAKPVCSGELIAVIRKLVHHTGVLDSSPTPP